MTWDGDWINQAFEMMAYFMLVYYIFVIPMLMKKVIQRFFL